MGVNKYVKFIEEETSKKIDEICKENGGTIPGNELTQLLGEMSKKIEAEMEREKELIEKVEAITNNHLLKVVLSINGRDGEPFTFWLHNDKIERLKQLYVEWAQQDGYQCSNFWNRLQCEECELAFDIEKSIYDELADLIPIGDQFNDKHFQKDWYPLRDLHYDYMNAEGEKVQNGIDAEMVTFNPDNVFECDFTDTFDLD